MIGAGTSRAIASSTVQRPSPESATQSFTSASSLPCASKARPISSSNHERITVPCIQASAMAPRSRPYSEAWRISKPSP